MTPELFGLLVAASGATIGLSAISILIGFAMASGLCAGMLSGKRWAGWLGAVFVSFFRGTPLLVQLLLIYHLLPQVGLNVPGELAAVMGLSFCTAAYQTEILRGGFRAVPKGFLEAAEMCGFSPAQTFLRIRLPIAVRLTLPALTSEAIMIVKASSLVSVVGVMELTRMAQDLSASTFMPVQLYVSAGCVYLVINGAIALVSLTLERRFRRDSART